MASVMLMNFEVTRELLEWLRPYVGKADIQISSDNGERDGREYRSDLVTLDEKNNVGFQVLEGEVIVFFLTDHFHFEDYTSDLEEDQDDYIKRAKEFLTELFTNRIKCVEIYKGKTLASERYYIVSDGHQERIGGTWWGLVRFINPFAKRREKVTVYRFDKEKGCFLEVERKFAHFEKESDLS